MNGKKTVLVADDDATFRTLLSNGFSDAGLGVIEAQDGEEALNLAKEKRPDILVIDIKMPKQDGLEMLKNLRATGSWGASVPAFILTNLEGMDTIARALESSTAGYFVKAEHTIPEIVRAVADYLASGH
ncbi:hypothetical protein A2118_00625 [Candidatus Kaiserbacteria bacterium GWA2_50_9]|uniref:Response regulatory domain-containing protein n=1 Tax=Candidatus Kaiserbacteria bacterium GWA2_50_9 TaxID=1798474 RepID=A0A1F6BVS7_9BACT|nr:MAG: hypothetical protein A2118_00625 [Candidatus Kaiserbacteria bacterium GWA2_50_9]